MTRRPAACRFWGAQHELAERAYAQGLDHQLKTIRDGGGIVRPHGFACGGQQQQRHSKSRRALRQ